MLYYPELVTPHNIKLMQALVRNGPDVYPGAGQIIIKSQNNIKKSLRYSKRDRLAMELKFGDVIERYLII